MFRESRRLCDCHMYFMPMALAGKCIMDADVPVRFKPSKFPALNIQKNSVLASILNTQLPQLFVIVFSSVSTTKAPRSKEFGPTYASQFLPKILPTINIITCSILKIHAPHNISQSKNVAKHLLLVVVMGLYYTKSMIKSSVVYMILCLLLLNVYY